MALPDRRQKDRRQSEQSLQTELRFHDRRAKQAKIELERVKVEAARTLEHFRLAILGLVVALSILLVAYKISGCF